MIEGDYFFGDELRWNLFWTSPNHAAAFVAVLIPLLWLLGALWRRSLGMALFGAGFLLVVEGGLSLALCKTFSRGGLVAWAAAWVLYAGWLVWNRQTIEARRLAPLHGLRLLLMGGLLFFTGAYERAGGEYVAQDASVGNRLVLWKGGLELGAAKPWSGVGVGNSGETYMQWYQPLGRDEGYRTLVNSYLTFAVERGIPLAALMLALLLFPFGLAFASGTVSGSGQVLPHLLVPLLCGLLALLTANVFSTLIEVPSLLWLGAAVWLSACIGAGLCGRGRLWRGLGIGAGLSGAVAVGCAGLTLLAGIVISARNPQSVKLHRNAITLERRDSELRKPVLLVPDKSVLGDRYGHELRLLSTAMPGISLRIISMEQVPGFLSSERSWLPEQVILVGHSAEYAPEMLAILPDIILVHPDCAPAENVDYKASQVVLPQFDQNGWNAMWEAKLSPRAYSAFTGQDIRSVWPLILVDNELLQQ